MTKIPKKDWVWCGYAGHLIVGYQCRFHLSTRVGNHRISTVGDYHPIRNGTFTEEPETIGAGHLYETFVFIVDGDGDHGEGEPTSWSQIDSDAYNDASDAERGHLAMCIKYAAIPNKYDDD